MCVHVHVEQENLARTVESQWTGVPMAGKVCGEAPTLVLQSSWIQAAETHLRLRS